MLTDHEPSRGQFHLKLSGADWSRRRDMALTIALWVGLCLLALYFASYVLRPILIVIVASLLAYALAPAVTLLQRVMPRGLAIGIVYLVFLVGIGLLSYFIITTAINQLGSLVQHVRFYVTPGAHGQVPLLDALHHLGFTQDQINGAAGQLADLAKGVTASIVPFLFGFFNVVLDIILVGVLSVYLMIDGERASQWILARVPLPHRGNVIFFQETIGRVVGGYIRGQLALSTLIGLMVGVGMAIFHVPYAVLLGVLAFVLEFIPILGTLVSGAICILVALSQGWVIAVLVLGYFVIVHVIEGDVVGPRIVGKAVGLHPAVSIVALIAGSELFGIWGALFAAPVAGLIQAFLAAVWLEWRRTHPEQFALAAETPAGNGEWVASDETALPAPDVPASHEPATPRV